MTRLWVGAVLVLTLPGFALADDDYRHGRIRYVEDGVSIQRAAEPGAEEAETNVPFLPGDRVWTDERGRVEFQFESGALLRLDNGTKLDYLDHRGDRVVLRLWSGGLYVHEIRGGSDFEIETPGGVVSTGGRGIYRIDARSGETRLSVYAGEATLQGSRSIRVDKGEQVYARDGEVVQGPMGFDRDDADDFARWAENRHEGVRLARQRPADLPQEAAPYYDELYDHGSWHQEPSIGYVWRPRVAFGWQPYSHGRWMWTAYGWTWLAHEPWGWAPFHYGRWGHSLAGWYWIPQRGWGPAWVTWALGGPYVGWSPLGFGNRPIIVHERRYRGGQAIPRAGSGSWVYARHGDITARDLARRRVQMDPAEMAQVRVLASPRARLSKDLRVVEPPVAGKAGAPRTARTKPTPGDTVPELRGGNETLPPPMAGRRRDVGERYDRGNSFGAAAGRDAKEAPGATRADPAAEAAPAERRARPAFGSGDSGRARGRHAEPSGEPASGGRPEAVPESAAPVTRSRYRGSQEAETPRQRGGEAGPSRSRGGDEGTPRQEYGVQPRERSREGGGERRSAPAEHSGSDGGGRARERAPRQEAAPPAAKEAPKAAPATREAAPSARRRNRD